MRHRALRFVLVFVLLGLVGFAACEEPVDPLAILWQGRSPTYEEAILLAQALDTIAGSLEAPPVDRSSESLHWWALEISPYFYYEGVTPSAEIPNTHWYYYEDESNFHVIGRYYLFDNIASLNVRFANPYSWRFYHRSFLATFVHEIGHSQGINFGFGDMEATNQLATLEVLASMTRDQNVWAFPAFVESLRDYAEDYAFSLALKQNRLEDYDQYIEQRADHMFQIASFARSMDHWATRMDELKAILSKYGETPFLYVIQALSAPGYARCDLRALPNDSLCLEMNDTAWVLQHLAELVSDYGKLTGQPPQLLEAL